MRRTTKTAIRWSQRERLRYLESVAFWRGRVQRADLSERFEVGPQRVSDDLREYMRLNPGALRYNRSLKAYETTVGMKPVLGDPSIEEGLALLGARPPNCGPWVDRVSPPHRRLVIDAVQRIFRAVNHGTSIRIRYASLHSSSFRWRWISPHAFGFDGFRWHVRAFCHEDKEFKDFVLGRVAEAEGAAPAAAVPSSDREWAELSAQRLGPAVELSASQVRALELDFGMRHGLLEIPVRSALRIYLLAQLGLSPDGASVPARFRPV